MHVYDYEYVGVSRGKLNLFMLCESVFQIYALTVLMYCEFNHIKFLTFDNNKVAVWH